VDGLSDRGSTPLRSIKRKCLSSEARGAFPFLRIGGEMNSVIGMVRFRTGALEVRWTSVQGRPERSGDQLPSGLGMTESAGWFFADRSKGSANCFNLLFALPAYNSSVLASFIRLHPQNQPFKKILFWQLTYKTASLRSFICIKQ